MAANPLSEDDVQQRRCIRSCRAPARRAATRPAAFRARTVAAGTSFQGNRFVLTGSPEGDFNVTLTMISDTCNPASNYLLSRPSTAAAPVGRDGLGAGAAAGGQRGLQRDQQLDPGRLRRADQQHEDRETMTESSQRTPRSAATVRCTVAAAAAVLGLVSCGGGNDNPLDNPNTLSNPTLSGNQRLRFSYFQTLRVPGVPEAAADPFCQRLDIGQHLRRVGLPRQRQRHRWRFSCHTQRAADRPRESGQYSGHHPGQRHVQELLFGAGRGGVRFGTDVAPAGQADGATACCTAAAWCSRPRRIPNARLLQYWINNPSPSGSDEFSDPTFGFTPGPVCNSQ